MKIHVPAFKAMAKCNSYLDRCAFDLEISDEALSAAGYEKVVRCKECKWWNHAGCAVYIVADSDKPAADDFCSFGERRDTSAEVKT